MIVVFISVLLVWFACLLAYLSSPKQQLLDKSLSKLSAWFGFTGLLTMALWGFSDTYSYLVSSLLMLMLVMVMWTLLILVASHKTKRIFSVVSLGGCLFLLITAVTFIGEHYVV
ncbi:hypothetical protein A9Q74_13560 [Colwellia sp. 39_35_sub15_T18]|nr:hypothetical protein A9Q74_13560 [Colwellia sp. 39_35_sub15_T18]